MSPYKLNMLRKMLKGSLAGGDLNLVLDPSKDRSSSTLKTLSQVAKNLRKEIADFKLVDVWREKHKSGEEGRGGEGMDVQYPMLIV
ncbi:hypothetical protein PAMP_006471 [Pampus punctatissimus]